MPAAETTLPHFQTVLASCRKVAPVDTCSKHHSSSRVPIPSTTPSLCVPQFADTCTQPESPARHKLTQSVAQQSRSKRVAITTARSCPSKKTRGTCTVTGFCAGRESLLNTSGGSSHRTDSGPSSAVTAHAYACVQGEGTSSHQYSIAVDRDTPMPQYHSQHTQQLQNILLAQHSQHTQQPQQMQRAGPAVRSGGVQCEAFNAAGDMLQQVARMQQPPGAVIPVHKFLSPVKTKVIRTVKNSRTANTPISQQDESTIISPPSFHDASFSSFSFNAFSPAAYARSTHTHTVTTDDVQRSADCLATDSGFASARITACRPQYSYQQNFRRGYNGMQPIPQPLAPKTSSSLDSFDCAHIAPTPGFTPKQLSSRMCRSPSTTPHGYPLVDTFITGRQSCDVGFSNMRPMHGRNAWPVRTALTHSTLQQHDDINADHHGFEVIRNPLHSPGHPGAVAEGSLLPAVYKSTAYTTTHSRRRRLMYAENRRENDSLAADRGQFDGTLHSNPFFHSALPTTAPAGVSCADSPAPCSLDFAFAGAPTKPLRASTNFLASVAPGSANTTRTHRQRSDSTASAPLLLSQQTHYNQETAWRYALDVAKAARTAFEARAVLVSDEELTSTPKTFLTESEQRSLPHSPSAAAVAAAATSMAAVVAFQPGDPVGGHIDSRTALYSSPDEGGVMLMSLNSFNTTQELTSPVCSLFSSTGASAPGGQRCGALQDEFVEFVTGTFCYTPETKTSEGGPVRSTESSSSCGGSSPGDFENDVNNWRMRKVPVWMSQQFKRSRRLNYAVSAAGTVAPAAKAENDVATGVVERCIECDSKKLAKPAVYWGRSMRWMFRSAAKVCGSKARGRPRPL